MDSQCHVSRTLWLNRAFVEHHHFITLFLWENVFQAQIKDLEINFENTAWLLGTPHIQTGCEGRIYTS